MHILPIISMKNLLGICFRLLFYVYYLLTSRINYELFNEHRDTLYIIICNIQSSTDMMEYIFIKSADYEDKVKKSSL